MAGSQGAGWNEHLLAIRGKNQPECASTRFWMTRDATMSGRPGPDASAFRLIWLELAVTRTRQARKGADTIQNTYWIVPAVGA